MAFAAVEAPGNSIELKKKEGHNILLSPFMVIQCHHMDHKSRMSYVDVGVRDSDDAAAVQDQSDIDLNSVPEVLRTDMTSFERVACQENLGIVDRGGMEEIEVIA